MKKLTYLFLALIIVACSDDDVVMESTFLENTWCCMVKMECFIKCI